jgi:lipopolysaccharide transport system ATP-binding protein
MVVRLGFAVATAVEPDLLILDEVLAVGDAAFRAKCYNRIGQIKKRAAVIFVSHNMQQVHQACTSVLFLKTGQPDWTGEVAEGVRRYEDDNLLSDTNPERVNVVVPPIRSGSVTLEAQSLDYGADLILLLGLSSDDVIANCCMRVVFYNREGTVVAEWNSKRSSLAINVNKGTNELRLRIGPIHLSAGQYEIGLMLNDSTGVFTPFWSLKQQSVQIRGPAKGACEYMLQHSEFVWR